MAVSYMHMEEWLFPPYEGLVEAAAEGLTSSSLESAEEEHVHNKENAKSAENDIKLAIRCHPRYPELLRAHMSFMKVGASPHQVAEFDEILEQQYNLRPETAKTSIGSNPELDQFMTTYCNALNSYVNELKKTFHEAMDYCKKQEEELCLISGEVDIVERDDWEEDYCYGDMEEAESCIQIDPNAGEKELKQMLMRKYGMYIKGLTQENLKKKKKGKLPKEARQKLFDWWNKHLDHPYPTEVEKADLAQSTELDPKQINNWFINQRKRHWNPTTTVKGESSKQGEARANTEEVYSA